MNPRTTGILFLVAAALGAFVWLYEIRGEAGRKDVYELARDLGVGVGDKIRVDTRSGDYITRA